LWVQLEALLPERPMYDRAHPLGCHRRRISDRAVFHKLLQVLRFGCPYEGVADSTCSATTIRNRRDEWVTAGVFAQFEQLALDAYDRIVGLLLADIAVDGCISKAPGGGEVAGPFPVDRRKQGMKRSPLVDGYGIPGPHSGRRQRGRPTAAGPHPGHGWRLRPLPWTSPFTWTSGMSWQDPGTAA
jgi:transposase